MLHKNRNPNQEKRLHPRHRLKLDVDFRVLKDRKEIESFLKQLGNDKSGATKDVSLGGLYLNCGHALREGDIVQMDINIPGRKEALKTYAEVVWVDENGGGFKFLSMSDNDKKCLDDFLEEQNLSS